MKIAVYSLLLLSIDGVSASLPDGGRKLKLMDCGGCENVCPDANVGLTRIVPSKWSRFASVTNRWKCVKVTRACSILMAMVRFLVALVATL